MIWKRFLIVRTNGDCRIVREKPKLSWNEVVFDLQIKVPDAWANVGKISIEIPESVAEVIVEGLTRYEIPIPEETPDA